MPPCIGISFTCRYWWPVCSSKFRQQTLLWHYQLWVCSWGRLVYLYAICKYDMHCGVNMSKFIVCYLATDQIWRTHQFRSTSLFQCPWWTKHDHTEHVCFTIFDACTDYFYNSSRTDILFVSSRYGVIVRKIPTYSLLLDTLYPPPACPVSHHFNTPQWPTVSCINPLLILLFSVCSICHCQPLHLSTPCTLFTVCPMEAQFRQRCVLHGHGRELNCMSVFDTWTASSMIECCLSFCHSVLDQCDSKAMES